MKKWKIVLVIITLTTSNAVFACKCDGPGTIKESFDGKDIVIYGRVTNIDTVVLAETLNEEGLRKLKDRLKGNKQKLQHFEMTYVLKVTFETIERYKGTDQRQVVVYTPLLGATCGYKFKSDGEYIVYASRSNFMTPMFYDNGETKGLEKENTSWTTHCTRTTEFTISEATELRRLKK